MFTAYTLRKPSSSKDIQKIINIITLYINCQEDRLKCGIKSCHKNKIFKNTRYKSLNRQLLLHDWPTLKVEGGISKCTFLLHILILVILLPMRIKSKRPPSQSSHPFFVATLFELKTSKRHNSGFFSSFLYFLQYVRRRTLPTRKNSFRRHRKFATTSLLLFIETMPKRRENELEFF